MINDIFWVEFMSIKNEKTIRVKAGIVIEKSGRWTIICSVYISNQSLFIDSPKNTYNIKLIPTVAPIVYTAVFDASFIL